jgi:hypothetical protein
MKNCAFCWFLLRLYTTKYGSKNVVIFLQLKTFYHINMNTMRQVIGTTCHSQSGRPFGGMAPVCPNAGPNMEMVSKSDLRDKRSRLTA